MKPTKAKLVKFIATVRENKIDQIKQIAAIMKKDGCTIDQVFEITGIITGKIADIKRMDKYKKKGIATIEEDRDFNLS